MLYVYLIVSAALIPLLNNFFPILRQSYSLWLVPVLFIGFFIALILLHFILYMIALLFVNLNKKPKGYRFFRTYLENSIALALGLIRVKVDLEVNDTLPQDGRVVLVCNHTHIIDPVMLMAALPELELAFLAKSEIKKQFFFVSRILYSVGGVFVERDSVRGAAKSMVTAIKTAKSKKVSMGIFPEGHRTEDGKLQEFKDGAFKIAQKCGTPLAVCTVRGVTEILHGFIFRKKTVKVKLLKVFSAEEIKTMTDTELCEKTRGIMLEDLGE